MNNIFFEKIDEFKDLLSKLKEFKYKSSTDEDISFYGTSKDNILFKFKKVKKYAYINYVYWIEVSKFLGIEKINGTNYYIVQNVFRDYINEILNLEVVWIRELRFQIINSDNFEKNTEFYIL